MQDPKNRQKVAIWAPSHNFVGLYLCNWGTYRQSKNLLSSNISSRCRHNMVNFDPLAAEIDPVVWGTPANFNGLCLLAALLHGISVVGVSQTLRRWTEGATCVRQGGHHVGHWPIFLVQLFRCDFSSIQLCSSWQYFNSTDSPFVITEPLVQLWQKGYELKSCQLLLNCVRENAFEKACNRWMTLKVTEVGLIRNCSIR